MTYAPAPTPSPTLSVIVPSVNGLEDLAGCLDALAAERTDTALEVVVVDRLGETVRQAVRSRYPWVHLVEVDTTASIPEMRAIGIRESRSPAIGVIEDHVLVRRGWAAQMLAALAQGARVVGGGIENGATGTLTDWAAFLCEYSHCLPPLQSGEVEWLTGNNVVYSRDLLRQHQGVIDEHKWEVRLHEAILGSGVPLICHPEITVDHKKHFTLREYLELRYQYSRSYAGLRIEGQPVAKKVVFGLGAAALPPILLYRIVKQVLAKGRHRDWLLRSIPLLCVFVLASAWGETVGYWLGAGDSLRKVT